jgi:N-acetylated-alpha-linked acidic dipeptidase
VQYLFDYPGDPLTPGKPAIPGTPRLKPEEATDLTRLPVQPIAYDVAKTILSQLKGPVRPGGFQGGLPFAYHVGGTNDVKLRLKTDMDYKLRKIWDVVARIDGNEEKDRWVILGNHRDAWVFGAVDPNSGSSTMLEVGHGLATLLKQGWKPRRTIILCSWDAEEYGLIGSTEWAEEFADELRDKAVAYLNLDAAVSGPHFWRFVSSFVMETDARHHARHQGSKDGQDCLSTVAGSRARESSGRRATTCRSADRSTRFRIGLHTVSSTPRNSID